MLFALLRSRRRMWKIILTVLPPPVMNFRSLRIVVWLKLVLYLPSFEVVASIDREEDISQFFYIVFHGGG